MQNTACRSSQKHGDPPIGELTTGVSRLLVKRHSKVRKQDGLTANAGRMDSRSKRALKNLAASFRSGQGTDFTVACQGHEIRTHRWFLAQSGGWFGALLKADRFLENSEHRVDVSDAGYPAEVIAALVADIYGLPPQSSARFDLSVPGQAAEFYVWGYVAGDYFQTDGFRASALQHYRDLSGLDENLRINRAKLISDTTARHVVVFSPVCETSLEDSRFLDLALQVHAEKAKAILGTADMVYRHTRDADRDLRDIVLQALVFHHQACRVDDEDAIQALIQNVPGLAAEYALHLVKVLHEATSVDTVYRCESCAADFAMNLKDEGLFSSLESLSCPVCCENAARIVCEVSWAGGRPREAGFQGGDATECQS